MARLATPTERAHRLANGLPKADQHKVYGPPVLRGEPGLQLLPSLLRLLAVLVREEHYPRGKTTGTGRMRFSSWPLK